MHLARDGRRHQRHRAPGLRPRLGPGTTSTRSSATRTSRSSRAGPRSPAGRWRPSACDSACSSAPTRSATRARREDTRRRSITSATVARSSARRRLVRTRAPAHGIDFGSGFGQRLDWLDESVAPAGSPRRRDGDLARLAASMPSTSCVTGRRPLQAHLPIMIGGIWGEEDAPHRRQVCRHVERDGPARGAAAQGRRSGAHCDAVGRDIAEIEFTLGVKLTIRDTQAEADAVWKACDGAQPDAADRRRG